VYGSGNATDNDLSSLFPLDEWLEDLDTENVQESW
jgi:hypothetical protein